MPDYQLIRLLQLAANVDASKFLMWIMATHPDEASYLINRYLNPEEACLAGIRAGDIKIHAIKKYRSWTGKGLKESKEAIDAICNREAKRKAGYL